MSETIYIKSCNCKETTATIGRIVFKTDIDNELIKTEIINYPGPICDKCNIPWKLQIKNNKPNSRKLKKGEKK